MLKSGGINHATQCARQKYAAVPGKGNASAERHQRLATRLRAMTYHMFVAVACNGLMAICISANVIALLGRKDTAYYLHLYTLVSQNARAAFGKKIERRTLVTYTFIHYARLLCIGRLKNNGVFGRAFWPL